MELRLTLYRISLSNLNGPNRFIIKIKRHQCFFLKSLDPALLLLNLIAIFRIKTYEDFGTNVPLIGISFAVFHIMGKTGLDFGEIGIHIRWYK